MVSCRAFWVAICYRLAARFARIGSRVRVELNFIGDRSSIMGTNYSPPRKTARRNDKNGPKWFKMCKNCVASDSGARFLPREA